ncbi:MAG: c-type cytochrome domain-containing protein [Planctomycetota bacterium]
MDRRFTGYAIAGALLASLAVPAMAQSVAIQDEVSYTQDIQPLVREFCTTCHAGDDPEGDFVLTSYDDVRQHAEQGTLLARINDEEDPMPQTGLLPKSMRHLFQRWVDGGFVNEGHGKRARSRPDYRPFTPPSIQPVDVNQRGFELLESMQGHWVGAMRLMGQDYDWMAFDYRAIAPSHVHGIFEGGTIGNLFTSFFVTDFEGTRTIMARNGGMLNGIYRTSYFVLDHVESGDDGTMYRLVDAYGGEGIMFMELTFHGDTLEFNSYTSRFGLTEPKLHMAFKAQRRHPELAAAAAAPGGFAEKYMCVGI